jgi:hypothetical protein
MKTTSLPIPPHVVLLLPQFCGTLPVNGGDNHGNDIQAAADEGN